MNYVAPLISGRYDFTFLPLSLPTPLVLALLSTSLAAQPSPFLPPTELSTLGLSVPSAGEGRSWVIVEAGRQLGTGMAIPGGRSTFAEAKLEIPFLRHPEAAPSMAFTLKQTILVDSLMMKLSSSGLTGLRSAKASFSVKEEDYAVKNWMELKAGSGDARGEGWSEELVRAVVEGWWIGERTGGTAVRFRMTSVSPPVLRPHIVARLHLPSFAGLSLEATRKLVGGLAELDAEGWITFEGQGWQLSESTRMEATKVAGL